MDVRAGAPSQDPARTALLIIDMQNDFLAEGGAFSKRHCDPHQLAQTVAWLARAARAQGRVVVWVTSVYGEIDAAPDALRGQTHTGSACCARGTWGAELFPALVPVRAERPAGTAEWHVEKRWYSAFRDTELHARLAEAGVTGVVLCGVATNVCVLAAARDARRLGYDVDILGDATAAGTAGKQAVALREIEGLGGRRRSWADLLSDGPGPVHIAGIGAGETALWCGALDERLAGDAGAFAAVEREVAWTTMRHRGGEVPRLVAIQGERSPDGAMPLYRHPVDEQPELCPFTPAVDRIRREVERRVGHPLNHCLLQLYRTGRDWISEHSDKTLDLVRPSFIVNVSLGRQRTMVLRPKRAEDGNAVQKVPLPHGSLLVMDLETNRRFYHAIRQEGDTEGEGDGHVSPSRISLTFRHIGTFHDPATGAVWGVGAPASDRPEAEARARARAAVPEPEREAAERGEAERMLQLFRAENVDPTFDVAAYRPGFEALNFRTLRASHEPGGDR
ncbi:isochorismatase family protein [Sorangium sp. So ce295]|uniref:isochorismatase family protein n=1 Tax=Sorangium sp. So ce295 TaxID=3133295 RepID=UPI003F61CE4C